MEQQKQPELPADPKLKEKPDDYQPEFMDLQIKFAQARQRVMPELNLADALFTSTSLYRRLGLPKPNDSNNPTWRQFAARIESGEDPNAVAYEFYLHRSPAVEEARKKERKQFGIFQSVIKEDVVRIYVGSFPREEARRDSVRKSLIELFTDIKRHHPEVKTVKGESWLFNRRIAWELLPEKFMASAKPDEKYFIGPALWGQFINGSKHLRKKLVDEFLKKLADLKNAEDIPKLFPYPPLKAQCDIEEFYQFCGIE